MGNKFFYEFSGRVFVMAEDKSLAESAVSGITLSDYLIDEDLYQVDYNYVAHNLMRREIQFGTTHHPLDDPDEFDNYRIRKYRYSLIFKDFLNGKFDRAELNKKMDDAENESLDDCRLSAEISMVDLETKKLRTARLVAVD